MVKLKCKNNEIIGDVQGVYEENMPKKSAIYKWTSHLKGDKKMVKIKFTSADQFAKKN